MNEDDDDEKESMKLFCGFSLRKVSVDAIEFKQKFKWGLKFLKTGKYFNRTKFIFFFKKILNNLYIELVMPLADFLKIYELNLKILLKKYSCFFF